jgi:hypothetical protein
MSTLFRDTPGEPIGFADDPIASHSAQFGLARPVNTPAGPNAPSAVGIRPWNLRAARTMGQRGTHLMGWRYDHTQQLALAVDGRRVVDLVAAEPTANSVSDLDGDEGKSEDWSYDFCPDNPGSPA